MPRRRARVRRHAHDDDSETLARRCRRRREPTSSSSRSVGWSLRLVVVGGALRLVVAGQDLYADELATYWVATAHGFTGVVETVATTAEITPPLSFLLTWLTTRLGLDPRARPACRR